MKSFSTLLLCNVLMLVREQFYGPQWEEDNHFSPLFVCTHFRTGCEYP